MITSCKDLFFLYKWDFIFLEPLGGLCSTTLGPKVHLFKTLLTTLCSKKISLYFVLVDIILFCFVNSRGIIKWESR